MPKEETSYRVIRIARRSENADFLKHPPNQDAPGEVFEMLAEEFNEFLKPNKSNPSRIEMKLPLEDPRLDKILQRSKELGLVLPQNSIDVYSGVGVQVRDYIYYSEEDISLFEFVECEGRAPFIVSSSQTSKSLERVWSDQYIKQCKNREIGSFVNLYHLIAVRGQAKLRLEESGLIGLKLIPLIPDKGWPSGVDPLYLIWSSETLPPVDEDKYVEYLGMRIQGERRKAKTLVDGYRIKPRLHYTQIAMPSVDIAVTLEQFGDTQHYHRIVYSQKARKVLASLGNDFIYTPVITPKSEQDSGGNGSRRATL